MDAVYLKPNIQVEPLIDSWYAWTHLLHPATAARNLTERHISIMQSYISAPQVHANAMKNPKMMGGPFIDYGGKRVDEIAALLKRTVTDRSYLITLSKAIAGLDCTLQAALKANRFTVCIRLFLNRSGATSSWCTTSTITHRFASSKRCYLGALCTARIARASSFRRSTALHPEHTASARPRANRTEASVQRRRSRLPVRL